MKRVTGSVFVVVFIFGLCSSMGAFSANTPGSLIQPDFAGKAVVFAGENWPETIAVNVRMSVVGDESYFIFVLPKDDEVEFDYWLPLEKIAYLKVFENMEEAIKYDKKTNPKKYLPENALKS